MIYTPQALKQCGELGIKPVDLDFLLKYGDRVYPSDESRLADDRQLEEARDDMGKIRSMSHLRDGLAIDIP